MRPTAPSPGSSTPSYSCCAIIIVFLTGNRAACCSLLVMNGGTAPFFRSFVVTEPTIQSASFRSASTASASAWLRDLDGRAVALCSLRIELRRHRSGETRRDVPVLFGNERVDFAFAVADELQRDRLHPARAQAAPDLVPEDGTDLVADQTIEHAPRLLRVDHLLVDRASDARSPRESPFLVISLNISRRIFFLGRAEFLGEMPADGFAFAIRVGRDVDVVGLLRRVFQFLQNLLAARR